ncbi:helix-turn-helix transcriptional regulator [Klebsiella pneumoniae]|uniref:helix-turn-helix domain-containing protein n=1 Tax=Klebsiella pneumoniae TaxID=573 RepID=UPI001FAD6BB3|nr:helix-turn-helix transcriptional regulator [Klebsiella pneumoniae]MCI7949279.1 helix-turn-helix transcriptional regulator [Klebsiella pneumoniae]
MNVTQLGRFLRKVRIDRGQRLNDMAEEMEMSVAQLSAIELGKRSISAKVKQRLITFYSAFCSGEEEVGRLVDVSQPSFKEDFEDADDLRRELFVSFARSYKALPEDQARQWLDELNELASTK